MKNATTDVEEIVRSTHSRRMTRKFRSRMAKATTIVVDDRGQRDAPAWAAADQPAPVRSPGRAPARRAATNAVASSSGGSACHRPDDLAIGQALQVPVVATWKHGRAWIQGPTSSRARRRPRPDRQPNGPATTDGRTAGCRRATAGHRTAGRDPGPPAKRKRWIPPAGQVDDHDRRALLRPRVPAPARDRQRPQVDRTCSGRSTSSGSILGVLLELGALVAYAELTHTVLSPDVAAPVPALPRQHVEPGRQPRPARRDRARHRRRPTGC